MQLLHNLAHNLAHDLAHNLAYVLALGCAGGLGSPVLLFLITTSSTQLPSLLVELVNRGDIGVCQPV